MVGLRFYIATTKTCHPERLFVRDLLLRCELGNALRTADSSLDKTWVRNDSAVDEWSAVQRYPSSVLKCLMRIAAFALPALHRSCKARQLIRYRIEEIPKAIYAEWSIYTFAKLTLAIAAAKKRYSTWSMFI